MPPAPQPTPLEGRMAALFAAASCDGFLHVRHVDGDREVGLDADTLVVAASVFKVAVALEFFRQAAAGQIDPAERVRVDPRASVPGPAGLALFSDEVEVSLRDLAVSMITVSDALATDALLERVGIEQVNALTRSLGLARTTIVGDVRSAFDSLALDVGLPSGRALLDHVWDDPAEESRVLAAMPMAEACDPTRATRTTAREMTSLLCALWRDEAAPAEACGAVRSLMGRQLQRQRIARGLGDGVHFSGKTGSFGGAFRNEVGVAEFPDGDRYAIAVFTRAHALYSGGRDIDDAIGVAAGFAVDGLRHR